MATNEHYSNGRLIERWSNGGQPGDPPPGYVAFDAAGNVTTQRALTDDETTALAAQDQTNEAGANRAQLQQRATAALAANANYLALGAPTNQQTVAQVQLLTRECSALIRLLLDELDSTAGT